jgi:alkaline phosphatase D
MRRLVVVSAGIGLLVVAVVSCRTLFVDNATGADAKAATVLWSGGVTSTSAHVHARLPASVRDTAASVRLAIGTDSLLHDARRVETESTSFGAHPFVLNDLTPGTTYHYALAINGRVDRSRRGRFRTFDAGPHSFRVVMGGCAETGSQHRVFDLMRRAQPDLLLHLGDLHYEDIDVADPEPFQDAYHRVHASRTQSALYRSVPIAYVWDDHDYGPNNSSRRAPGQDVAQQMYRAFVPHYALPTGPGAHPIHQAFTVGRVRFLVTDLRSARTPNDAVGVENRTMMGAEQKAWFKAQLQAARDRYPVIAWVSSVPWIADDPDALDRWSGYPSERRELATFIDSIGVADQLVMLSGDAHMVALDDGTNNRYGQLNGGGFPVVHAAALDRRGSVKGGPYTHGPYPNRVTLFGDNDGQFVVMDVQDDGGDEVCITWTGKRVAYDAERPVDLLEWTTCFPARP